METRLQRARAKLGKTSVKVAAAFIIAFSAGTQVTTDERVPSQAELDAVMGVDVVRNQVRVGEVLRYDKATDTFAVVAVSRPDSTWTVEELDDYLLKYEYCLKLVKGLRADRLEFEEALAESISIAESKIVTE